MGEVWWRDSFHVRVLREKQTIFFHLYPPSHWNWFLESGGDEISWSVTSTVISVAREVEGRHHGIGQLTGEFICRWRNTGSHLVAGLPTGGLQELACIDLGLHPTPKLAHLPPNTTQNTWWAASSHCSTSEADPLVYV